jgi:hypothetical protein
LKESNKCCKKSAEKEQSDFSDNIYKELKIPDLKREYQKSKQEKFQLRADILKGDFDKDDPLLNYYMARLEEKFKSIKDLLNKWLREKRLHTI